jgi:hypothetical protein
MYTIPYHTTPVVADVQLLHEAGHVRRTRVHAAAGQRILQLVGLHTQETGLLDGLEGCGEALGACACSPATACSCHASFMYGSSAAHSEEAAAVLVHCQE